MKLQTFLVSSSPFVVQADRTFAGVNLLLGAPTMTAAGSLLFHVLVVVLDAPAKPIQCRFEFRRGNLLFGQSSVIQAQPTTRHHVFTAPLQIVVPEPGDYEVVALVDGHRFVYPLPFEAPGVVKREGGIN